MGPSGTLPGWQLCRGISGSIRVEWVAGFVWNQWQAWSGIRSAPIRIIFLDDRIEIESMGVLMPGLTIEEIKRGTSRIRNHVIARVFRELNLIEQWGTGVRRIFERAAELDLPEPLIEEVGMRLRLTVYLAAAHQIRTSSEGGSERQPPGLESGLESLADRILMCLLPSPLSKSELAKALGHNSISSKLNQRVNELLERGEIVRTLPNKPTSRLQKYRLTDSGNARIQLMASNKDNSGHGNDK